MINLSDYSRSYTCTTEPQRSHRDWKGEGRNSMEASQRQSFSTDPKHGLRTGKKVKGRPCSTDIVLSHNAFPQQGHAGLSDNVNFKFSLHRRLFSHVFQWVVRLTHVWWNRYAPTGILIITAVYTGHATSPISCAYPWPKAYFYA